MPAMIITYTLDILLSVYILKCFFIGEIVIDRSLYMKALAVGIAAYLLSGMPWGLDLVLTFLFLAWVILSSGCNHRYRRLFCLTACFQFYLLPVLLVFLVLAMSGQGFEAAVVPGVPFFLINCGWDLWLILMIRRQFREWPAGLGFQKRHWALMILTDILTASVVFSIAFSNEAESAGGTVGRYFSVLLGTVTILVNGALYLYLLKSRTAGYYRREGELNRRYMEEQLRYFRAYKETQEETRRFRHDVKNHLLCMEELSRTGEWVQLSRYIGNLTDQWRQLPRLFYTGNDVVDAVVNGKMFLLSEKAIELRLEGRFNTELPQEPADLCCIFSNAIDNAAASGTDYLDISIRRAANFYLITFRNACGNVLNRENGKIVTGKKDRENHGFGLLNIKRAAEKTGGYMEAHGDEHCFELQVTLPG